MADSAWNIAESGTMPPFTGRDGRLYNIQGLDDAESRLRDIQRVKLPFIHLNNASALGAQGRRFRCDFKYKHFQ